MKARFVTKSMLQLLMLLIFAVAPYTSAKRPPSYHVYGEGFENLYNSISTPYAVQADAVCTIWCDYPSGTPVEFVVTLKVDGVVKQQTSIGIPRVKPGSPNLQVYWTQPLDSGSHHVEFYSTITNALTPGTTFSFYLDDYFDGPPGPKR